MLGQSFPALLLIFLKSQKNILGCWRHFATSITKFSISTILLTTTSHKNFVRRHHQLVALHCINKHSHTHTHTPTLTHIRSYKKILTYIHTSESSLFTTEHQIFLHHFQQNKKKNKHECICCFYCGCCSRHCRHIVLAFFVSDF